MRGDKLVNIPQIELQVLYIAGALALIEIFMIARYRRLRFAGLSFGSALEMRGAGKALKSSGRNSVQAEMERLRAGGEFDNDLVNNLSQGERVIFEVAIIDALTKWTLEEQSRLRRALLRYGFD